MGRMALIFSKRTSGGGNIRDGGGHKRRRNIRSAVRKHGSDAAQLVLEKSLMPEAKEIDRLQAIRDLLREGRTTEADKQIDTLQEQIRQEEERRKRETPPPGPKTLAQLESE